MVLGGSNAPTRTSVAGKNAFLSRLGRVRRLWLEYQREPRDRVKIKETKDLMISRKFGDDARRAKKVVSYFCLVEKTAP